MSILTILEKPKLFDFCLLMGPCVALNPDMASPVKIFFGKLISSIMPSLQLGGISLEEVTRDLEWVKRPGGGPDSLARRVQGQTSLSYSAGVEIY